MLKKVFCDTTSSGIPSTERIRSDLASTFVLLRNEINERDRARKMQWSSQPNPFQRGNNLGILESTLEACMNIVLPLRLCGESYIFSAMKPDAIKLERLVKKVLRTGEVSPEELVSHWQGLPNGNRIVINLLNRQNG